MYRFFDDGRNNSFIVRETRLSPSCVLSFRLETDALFHYRFPECRTIKRNHELTRAKVLDDILVEIYSPHDRRRFCGDVAGSGW